MAEIKISQLPEITSGSYGENAIVPTVKDGVTYKIDIKNLKSSILNGLLMIGEVNSVPNGTSSSATITGTYPHQYLNLDIEEGADGIDAYCYIKYSDTNPDSNDDIKNLPSEYMGVYTGTSSTAPVNYTDYTWYKIKGDSVLEINEDVLGDSLTAAVTVTPVSNVATCNMSLGAIYYIDNNASTKIVISNPRMNKQIVVELSAAITAITFPTPIENYEVIIGEFITGRINRLYFHCIDATTPKFLITITPKL